MLSEQTIEAAGGEGQELRFELGATDRRARRLIPGDFQQRAHGRHGRRDVGLAVRRPHRTRSGTDA